jgi:hypothetical protein
LQKNLNAANLLQRGLFLFRGLSNNADRLSTVTQALIFVFEKIHGRFKSEIDDLSLILQYQAGLIAKSQLTLAPTSQSAVLRALNHQVDTPLTLMRLDQLLFGSGNLFSKMETLVETVERGVLDYVAHTHG